MLCILFFVTSLGQLWPLTKLSSKATRKRPCPVKDPTAISRYKTASFKRPAVCDYGHAFLHVARASNTECGLERARASSKECRVAVGLRRCGVASFEECWTVLRWYGSILHGPTLDVGLLNLSQQARVESDADPNLKSEQALPRSRDPQHSLLCEKRLHRSPKLPSPKVLRYHRQFLFV